MAEKYLQSQSKDEPLISANQRLPEITLRVLVLGAILTILLAAANAYLALRMGQTISASIPAAIISMSILRFFKRSNVLENTMVQTMASVGEAIIGGIAYILPALIILHAWNSFHYWQTVVIALIGGILGVLYTIPLRRALLQDKTLRYPEGMAIANVLKAKVSSDSTDSKSLLTGGIVGAVISLFQTGFQILTDSFAGWITVSKTVIGLSLGLSPAMIAAGYIVGINVGLSIFVGVIIGWLIGVPFLTWYFHFPVNSMSAHEVALTIWRSHTRYIGVGTMLIGGLWTLFSLIKPIGSSILASFSKIKQAKLGTYTILRTERDIPIQYVLLGCLVLLIPLYFLIHDVLLTPDMHLSSWFRIALASISTLFVLVGGFIFCSLSAYFAGLIGSSNSPVSGLLVCSLLILCLLLLSLFLFNGNLSGNEMTGIIVGIGSAVVIGAAIPITNDTMQDLKVGHELGATPWKQQVMLLIGVVISALIMPPIFDLLYNAYGVGGVYPHPNMDPAQTLAAPQASMMAAIASGVYTRQIEWSMIIAGMVIAVFCIIIDEFLKKRGHRLPVLAVGLGIYLPLEASVPAVVGGLLSYLVNQKLNKVYPLTTRGNEKKITHHRHRGLLLTCGMVAGSSIIGVVLAIPFALKQSTDALRLMPHSLDAMAGLLSLFVTFILCAWIYRAVLRK